MKKYPAILCWFLFGLVLLFSSCSDRLEQDAVSLANIQQQRKKLIHRMLKTKDNVDLAQYKNTLLTLDAEYKKLNDQYEQKYADSSSKARFDKAFNDALNTKK